MGAKIDIQIRAQFKSNNLLNKRVKEKIIIPKKNTNA
jgi:hypothetical protein